METINPQEWKQDLPAFKEKTDQFYAGELSKEDYKIFKSDRMVKLIRSVPTKPNEIEYRTD